MDSYVKGLQFTTDFNFVICKLQRDMAAFFNYWVCSNLTRGEDASPVYRKGITVNKNPERGRREEVERGRGEGNGLDVLNWFIGKR